MKLAVGLTITSSIQLLGSWGNKRENLIQKISKVALPGNLEPEKKNKLLSSDFHRMLRYQGDNVFYSSPYSVGIENMNQNWHNAQLAWHLLGFYVDCTNYSEKDAEDYKEQREHREEGKGRGPERRRAQHQEMDDLGKDNGHDRDQKDILDESDGNDNDNDVQNGAQRCIRKTMYAVYVDPSYQGGGAGEYRYYNETIGQYKCYSAKCRAKMDCHSSNSETWTLLGIFKVDGISQSWIEQLPQNHTLGHWRWGDYSSFISAATEKLPNGCTKTKYKANGSYLYIDIKPEKNAKIDLAFYTNSICTILYKGKNDAFDLYDLIGTSYSDMVTFNSLLDGYKICQPCVTYSLKNNWTTQMIFNVTKNHSYHIYYKNHSNPFYFGNYSHYARYNKINQCQKFAINAQSSAATPQEISLAYRQHGMLQIGNLNYEADMISFKRLEADLPYDIVNNIPLSLQFAIIFFLGSLIFFCTSPNVLSPEGVIAKKFAIFESDGRVGALFYKLFSNQNGEECLPSDLGMRKENSLSVNTGGEACTQPNGKTEIISRGDGAKKTPLLWSKEGTGAQPILLPRLDGEPIANQVSNINGEEYFTRGGDMSKKTKTSASVNIEGATCTQLSKPRNKQKIESRGNATKKTPLSRSKEGKGALPLSLPKPEGTLSADQFSKLNSTVNFSIGEDMSKRTSLSMNNVAARSTQLSESNHKPKIVSRGDTETKTMVLGSSNSTVTLMRSLPRPEGTPIDNVTKETPLVVSDRREGATSLSTQKFKQKKVFRLLSKLAKHAKFSSRGDDSSSTAR